MVRTCCRTVILDILRRHGDSGSRKWAPSLHTVLSVFLNYGRASTTKTTSPCDTMRTAIDGLNPYDMFVLTTELGMRRYGDISIQYRYGGSRYVSWPSAIYRDTTLTFVIRGSHHVVSIFCI